MNSEQAIKVFEGPYHFIDSSPNCNYWAKIDEAVKVALPALRFQQNRENPKPLTLEELKERVGRPVWIVQGNQKYPKECETILVEIFRESDNGKYIEFWKFGEEVEEGLLIDYYGKTWLAYDHEPKEAR